MDKRIKVLEQIRQDIAADAKAFDRQPFSGKTVGTYFGNHGAAIAGLADIIRSILETPTLITNDESEEN